MRNWFDPEAPVMRFLTKVMDLILLNLCFLISCIPVITIGAALTALFSVALKMVRNEEGAVVGSYWDSWRANLKQGAGAFLGAAFLAAALYFDLLMTQRMEGAGLLQNALLIVICVLATLIASCLLFLFPYIARFTDTLFTSVVNAGKLAAMHPIYTIVALAVLSGLAVLTFWSDLTMIWMVFFWLLLGFALCAYVQSAFLRTFFDPLEHE